MGKPEYSLVEALKREGDVEIQDTRFGYGVFASRQFRPGDTVLVGYGELLTQQTAHSIQVDDKVHFSGTAPLILINHSCDPNCGLWLPRAATTVEVRALKPIAAGEQLFIDYESFETNIKFMSNCECGSSICRRRISGYDALPRERREVYGDLVAHYLIKSSDNK